MSKQLIKAVIVDDEPGCISNLQFFLNKYCPLIRVVATAENIEGAITIFKEIDFDVAFLDVEFGTDNIFPLLQLHEKNNLEIVFVTAFESYALKAFKAKALDYILKPLLKNDIRDCYQKILTRFGKEELSGKNSIENGPHKLLMRKGDKVYIVPLSDVYYMEAKGAYTQVTFTYHNKQTSLIISRPVGDLEKEYNNPSLYRVHKSFLVNCNRIREVLKGEFVHILLENGTKIPVAKRRMHEFLTFLEKS